MDVDHLKGSTRSFEVRRPKFEEGCPEVSIREGPEELTLRAEKVGSQKACINVPPLEDADWHAFCQAFYKGIDGRDQEKLYVHYKEMGGAAGQRKPMEVYKSESPLENAGDQRQERGS